jgi:hypothetical protein
MPQTSVTIDITTPASLSIAQLVMVLSDYWGYSSNLPDGTQNPQTRVQFVRARVAQFVRDSYIAAKRDADLQAAQVASMAASSELVVD